VIQVREGLGARRRVLSENDSFLTRPFSPRVYYFSPLPSVRVLIPLYIPRSARRPNSFQARLVLENLMTTPLSLTPPAPGRTPLFVLVWFFPKGNIVGFLFGWRSTTQFVTFVPQCESLGRRCDPEHFLPPIDPLFFPCFREMYGSCPVPNGDSSTHTSEVRLHPPPPPPPQSIFPIEEISPWSAASFLPLLSETTFPSFILKGRLVARNQRLLIKIVPPPRLNVSRPFGPPRRTPFLCCSYVSAFPTYGFWRISAVAPPPSFS